MYTVLCFMMEVLVLKHEELEKGGAGKWALKERREWPGSDGRGRVAGLE